jgi:antitoxin ParD1/3/4
MTITLEVPPHLEGRLRDSIARGDAAEAQRLLAEAFASTVAEMLREAPPLLSDAEFEALADQLADDVEACSGDAAAFLSKEALTREGIYGDHP